MLLKSLFEYLYTVNAKRRKPALRQLCVVMLAMRTYGPFTPLLGSLCLRKTVGVRTADTGIYERQ